MSNTVDKQKYMRVPLAELHLFPLKNVIVIGQFVSVNKGTLILASSGNKNRVNLTGYTSKPDIEGNIEVRGNVDKDGTFIIEKIKKLDDEFDLADYEEFLKHSQSQEFKNNFY